MSAMLARSEAGLDAGQLFLPAGLARLAGFGFLSHAEQRLASQVQARTYAAMFRLIARAVGAAEPVAFAQLEALMARCMAEGWRFVADAEAVATLLRARSRWSVAAFSCHASLAAQSHYRQSLEAGPGLDPARREQFRRHWQDSAQRAQWDEQEWREVNAVMDAGARDRAVGDLILAFGTLDGLVQAQAGADARYFARACGRPEPAGGGALTGRVESSLLHAYRWQYILSGVQMPHFAALLSDLLDGPQFGRIAAALAPLFDASRPPGVAAVETGG